jgi:hypothetical protein
MDVDLLALAIFIPRTMTPMLVLPWSANEGDGGGEQRFEKLIRLTQLLVSTVQSLMLFGW